METSVHFLHIFSKCTSYTHWKKKGLQRYFKLISNFLFSNTIQTFYRIRNHIEFHIFWLSHVNDATHKFSSHLKSTVSYYSTCKKIQSISSFVSCKKDLWEKFDPRFCIMQEIIMRNLIPSFVLCNNVRISINLQFCIMQYLRNSSINLQLFLLINLWFCIYAILVENAIPNFVLCNTSEVSKSINPKFFIGQYLRRKISSKFCAMDICFQFDHAVMFSRDAVFVCACATRKRDMEFMVMEWIVAGQSAQAPKQPSSTTLEAQLPWKSNQAKFSSGNNFCLKLAVFKLEHHKLALVDHWTGWKFKKTAWSSSSSSLVNPQLPFPNPESSILNPNPNPNPIFNPYPIFNS
jgi:hypothetical protein